MSKMNTPQTMMFTSQLLAFIQSRTFGMNFCARVWNSRKSSSGSAATRMVAPMNGNAEKNPDLELPSIGWLLFLPDSSPNDWIASCPTVITFATRLLTEPLSQAVLREDRGRWVSLILAAVIASVFFGVYHFAHSPPFNTVPLVVFLSLIGLVTSVFFFVSRDVYGTIAFYNFLGIFGVIGALDASGNLTSFERPIIPLLVMAVVAVALLVAAHILWLNSEAAPTPQRVR